MSNKNSQKTKTITLGDLFAKIAFALTAEQALSMFNRLNGNADAMQRELKPILTPHKVALEAAGFVPEWLSYAIPYYLVRAAEQHAQQSAAETTARILEHQRNPWSGN